MMKKKMPSEGLRLGRDSGSILCDTLKKWRFRTGWGGGRAQLHGISDIPFFLYRVCTIILVRLSSFCHGSFHMLRFGVF